MQNIPYNPTLERPNFPDEDTIVDMELHCDYFNNICGTYFPPIVSDRSLIEAKQDEKFCEGTICDNEDKALYYNYHCLGCYEFLIGNVQGTLGGHMIKRG